VSKIGTMLSFNDVGCRREGKLLFSNVNCVIHAGQKIGLTGANGCGKSSLFAMIQGSLEADTGVISLQQNVGITHVAQETPSSLPIILIWMLYFGLNHGYGSAKVRLY